MCAIHDRAGLNVRVYFDKSYDCRMFEVINIFIIYMLVFIFSGNSEGEKGTEELD